MWKLDGPTGENNTPDAKKTWPLKAALFAGALATSASAQAEDPIEAELSDVYRNAQIAQITNSTKDTIAQQLPGLGLNTDQYLAQNTPDYSSGTSSSDINFDFDNSKDEDRLLADTMYLDVNGSWDENIEWSLSYVRGSTGISAGVSRVDRDNNGVDYKVDQQFATIADVFTVEESDMLGGLLSGGELKASYVEAQVESAFADYDQETIAAEAIVKFRDTIITGIGYAVTGSKVNVVWDDSIFRQVNSFDELVTTFENRGNQIIQNDTTFTTNEFSKLVGGRVNTQTLTAMWELGKDLDGLVSYSKIKTSRGDERSSLGARVNYSLRPDLKAFLDYRETTAFSFEPQKVKTAGLNWNPEYNKGRFNLSGGLRDVNGSVEPTLNLTYQYDFGGKLTPESRRYPTNKVSTVSGSRELYGSDVIREERKTETTSSTVSSVENIAEGLITGVDTTDTTCTVFYDVTDADWVKSVTLTLGGQTIVTARSAGRVTFEGLSPNTRFNGTLSADVVNGNSGNVENTNLGSYSCRTLETTVDPEPTPEEDPTNVSNISGPTTLQVGDTATYTFTASDADNGIADATVTINGTEVPTTVSGDQYSFDLPASLTASAGTLDIQLSVSGTKEDRSADTPETRSLTVNVEAAPVVVPDAPSVSFTAPAAWDTSVTFTADTAPGNTTMWFLDGVAVPGETWSSYTASGLSLGTHTVSAQSCLPTWECSVNSADQSFDITPAISTPSINPIGTVTIDDDWWAASSVAFITGTDISSWATYSIISGPFWLTLSWNELRFQADVNGNQSYAVKVRVVNPDGWTDMIQFTLEVNDTF